MVKSRTPTTSFRQWLTGSSSFSARLWPTASAIAGDIVELAGRIDCPPVTPARETVPAFQEDDAPCAWAVRLEHTDAEKALRALGGARVVPCGDALAALTAPMAETALTAALDALRGANDLLVQISPVEEEEE